MSDLHSKAAQTYEGNRNFLVCPEKMADEILQSNDPWLKQYPNVGILSWDGKDKFRVRKRCKENYDVKDNDWKTLVKGMILSNSTEIRNYRNIINNLTKKLN